ncbi:hypothetical protein BJ322DRAFT_977710, partial [Thelephora terrestris]
VLERPTELYARSEHSLTSSRLLSIQRSTNLLNPMDRIPPESLTSIFDFTCRPDGRTKGTGFLATNLTGYGKDIVTLTHVCRYWRATILSNPKFWTTANLTHGFMTSALLKRSRSMPI